ncbi:MAG: ribosome-associated heat shock protein Hsp15 [Pseudomonadota bacterium]|nr:ribosome-associated heat shock protein Hsp15 [Pseudomonadota bacterium]
MARDAQKIRLDKWLWAARFFKTRSLATEAINGGKVHLNGQRVKPAKEVQIGDELTVRTGHVERSVIVRGLNHQRRPASEATLLYEETPESIAKRQQAAALRQQEVAIRPRGSGRPTKKERRHLDEFVQKNPYSKK